MAPTTNHPDAETLAAFGLGRLPAQDRQRIEQHISQCEECCKALENVGADTLVGLARSALISAHSETPLATAPSMGTMQSPSGIPASLVNHPRYQVIKRIGAGGMGTVFKAEHKMMGRTVALKVIHPRLVADEGARDRFRQEVRLASRLEHPNIVTAYDADQAEDMQFLVMEYVDGVSLDRLIAKRGVLPVVHACTFIRQAALGLQHAFERGMVHRDIKPHNLMVTRKGQIKILDFGLARMAVNSDTPAQEPSVTAPHIVLGTPDFLAPEQARNSSQVDIRADLYALGCTLYFLLAGKVPFQGDSAWEKLLAHANDNARPIEDFRQDLPAGLADLLRKLMAKNPDDRYQTPAELASALLPFIKASAEPLLLESVTVAQEEMRLAPSGNSQKSTLLEPNNGQDSDVATREPKKKLLSRRQWIAGGISVLGLGGIGLILGRDKPKATNTTTEPTSEKQASNSVAATPKGKPVRILLLLSSKNFWGPDYYPVRRLLEKEGCSLAVASSVRGTAKPDPKSPGSEVPIDMLVSEVKTKNFDALIIFGGEGMNEFLSHNPSGPATRKMIVEMNNANKIVAAICMGPGILADVGIVQGKRITANPWFRTKLEKSAIYVDTPVEIDGNIITARDDRSAEQFTQAVLSETRKKL